MTALHARGARRCHSPSSRARPLVAWLVAWFAEAPAADWVAFTLLRLEPGSHLGEAVAFFLEDLPKVLLLLPGIVTVVTLIRGFFPPERIRPILAGRGLVPGSFAAAGLGIVTPFCSCSAVPLFIGFVEAGVPLGVTFAFLISSPMVNEVALVMLWGLFGPGIALALHGRRPDRRHRRRPAHRPAASWSATSRTTSGQLQTGAAAADHRSS